MLPLKQPPAPCADRLVRLFEQCFFKAFNTRLVAGGEEPEYLPADGHCGHHRIIFTRDYRASALHEVAHWCVAGQARRLLPDYGYWYAADGRSPQQQAEFERVEVKPQALEWLFSRACGIGFRVSADNLQGNLGPSEAFKQAISQQAQRYCLVGLSPRANTWLQALSQYYGIEDALNPEYYTLARLI